MSKKNDEYFWKMKNIFHWWKMQANYRVANEMKKDKKENCNMIFRYFREKKLIWENVIKLLRTITHENDRQVIERKKQNLIHINKKNNNVKSRKIKDKESNIFWWMLTGSLLTFSSSGKIFNDRRQTWQIEKCLAWLCK